MDPLAAIHPDLTRSDHLVLRNLFDDVEEASSTTSTRSEMTADLGYSSLSSSDGETPNTSTRGTC